MEHHGDLLTALQRHTSAAAARYGELDLLGPAELERAELEQPTAPQQPLDVEVEPDE